MKQRAPLAQVTPPDPPRLLDPVAAAAYLGLGSRWAMLRAAARHGIVAVRVLGKLRFDRRDLDRFIEVAKGMEESGAPAPPGPRRSLAAVPRRLAPRRRVTASVTASPAVPQPPAAADVPPGRPARTGSEIHGAP